MSEEFFSKKAAFKKSVRELGEARCRINRVVALLEALDADDGTVRRLDQIWEELHFISYGYTKEIKEMEKEDPNPINGSEFGMPL